MPFEDVYNNVPQMAQPASVSQTIYTGDPRRDRVPGESLSDTVGRVMMPSSTSSASEVNVMEESGTESPSNPSQDFGTWLNDISGIGSSTQVNIDEAEKDRAYQTAERIAAQEYNSAEAIAAWERSEISAEKARQFEKEMASTQYQRMMADAYKAGLNPLLLAQGGMNAAGTASGNAASSSAASISASSGAKATAAGNSASIVAALISAVGNLFGKFIPLLGS